MTKTNNLIQNETMQYLIFLAISLVIIGFTAALFFDNNRIFQRFLGMFNPLMVVGLTTILGLIFLSVLLARGFSIYDRANWVGVLLAAGLAVVFGVAIIFIDIKSPLAEDINIAFPQSLLFYPTMGFIVEVVFHVGLLAILLFVLERAFEGTRDNHIIWACIIVVALVEPVYQTILGGERPYPLWPDLTVAFHIFLINIVQLALFKRYDFVTMYAFRLVYYLIWHIGWGHWRLALLF